MLNSSRYQINALAISNTTFISFCSGPAVRNWHKPIQTVKENDQSENDTANFVVAARHRLSSNVAFADSLKSKLRLWLIAYICASI